MPSITLPNYMKRHQSRTWRGAIDLAIDSCHHVGIYASAGHPGVSSMSAREFDSSDMWHEVMIAIDADPSLVYVDGVGL